jgi:hypothetical protein
VGVHRIAVTRLRCHAETQNYIERKRAEGKSSKDAIRSASPITRAQSSAATPIQ